MESLAREVAAILPQLTPDEQEKLRGELAAIGSALQTHGLDDMSSLQTGVLAPILGRITVSPVFATPSTVPSGASEQGFGGPGVLGPGLPQLSMGGPMIPVGPRAGSYGPASGGGGKGAFSTPRKPKASDNGGACNICGSFDHWQRECPAQQQWSAQSPQGGYSGPYSGAPWNAGSGRW